MFPLDSQAFGSIPAEIESAKIENDKKSLDFWNQLSYTEQQLALYHVVKLMHKAAVIDKGTFAHALYDIFGFKPDAFDLAIDCGYMDIHRRLLDCIEYKQFNHARQLEVYNNDGSYEFTLEPSERLNFSYNPTTHTFAITIDDLNNL